AEDGIRDPLVTGVQTCALPICAPQGDQQKQPCDNGEPSDEAATRTAEPEQRQRDDGEPQVLTVELETVRSVIRLSSSGKPGQERSEERRVGNECKSREQTIPSK